MTTIIIIVVVALVFFVTVCVVTFMVWKRETEIRTDSIRAIESNLEKLGDRLAADTDNRECAAADKEYSRELSEMYGRKHDDSFGFRRRESIDPFSWVRERDDKSDTFTEETKAVQSGNINGMPEEKTERPIRIFEEEEHDKEQFVHDDTEISYDDIELEDKADSNMNFNESDFSEPQTEERQAQVQTDSDLPYDDEWLGEFTYTEGQAENHRDVPEIIAANQGNDTESNIKSQNTDETKDDYAEISLDFGDDIDGAEYDFPSEILPSDSFSDSFRNIDMDEFEDRQYKQSRADGRDIGRSGKKYTAEELDMLIKE